MQNNILDPLKTFYVKSHNKPISHHLSRTNKYNRRSSHKSYKYADIGFTITKQNKKYLAICRICNRALGNTAYARLKGHRNICKLPSADECTEEMQNRSGNNQTFFASRPDSPSQQFSTDMPHLLNNQDTYVTSPQSISQDCVFKTTDNNSRMNINEVTPKMGSPQEFQFKENVGFFKIYHNSDQESQITDEENDHKLKMIEVLLLIRYYKKLLFKEPTKESIEVWMKVLKKAQALGLAPNDVPWTYARDSLYFVWRLHTQQKKDAMQSGELNANLSIVDVAILQIENANNGNSNFLDENLANNSTIDSSSSFKFVRESKAISTQTSDEMYEADLRLKLLQCEALEIDNYKRRLEILELERKLKISPSNFSAKLISSTHIYRSEKSNGDIEETCNNLVKIEIDD